MNKDFGGAVTILVVEDDAAVAELLRAVLNHVPGWGATVVHDAAAAPKVFRHVRIDVLVLDVNLSGISGLELLERLRQDPHWDDPTVLLLSAEADQAADRTREAMHFLTKPFDVDTLVAEVADAVELKR